MRPRDPVRVEAADEQDPFAAGVLQSARESVTYFVEILRGVVLRGADFTHLAPSVAGRALCCVAILSLSIARFRKQIG